MYAADTFLPSTEWSHSETLSVRMNTTGKKTLTAIKQFKHSDTRVTKTPFFPNQKLLCCLNSGVKAFVWEAKETSDIK